MIIDDVSTVKLIHQAIIVMSSVKETAAQYRLAKIKVIKVTISVAVISTSDGRLVYGGVCSGIPWWRWRRRVVRALIGREIYESQLHLQLYG